MSANKQNVSLRSVRLGSEEISFELRRSERKTLGVTVEPDLSLVVRAPRHAADERILSHLKNKTAWILNTRREFALYLPNRSERRYVPGRPINISAGNIVWRFVKVSAASGATANVLSSGSGQARDRARSSHV